MPTSRQGHHDVVNAHQVLQHLTDPVGALREMRRVTRPGGVVAVRGADAAATWYPAAPALDRWSEVDRAAARAHDAEPDIAAGWRAWATSEDGWFAVLHGELLCRGAA